MRFNCLTGACFVGFVCLPGHAIAETIAATPLSLARSAAVAGLAQVERVEPAADPSARQECAVLTVTEGFRGVSPGAVVRACYTTVRHIELGPGPRVLAGEEAVFFGRELLGSDLVLANEYRGLVSASNMSWTLSLGSSPLAYLFSDFRDAVRLAFAFDQSEGTCRGARLMTS